MEFFAGPARGGGRAPGPGPGLQQPGGGVPGAPARGPWGQYNPPRGLHPPQAGASYGGGPRLGLQQPGGPGNRGPGLGMHPPGGPYCGGPGPGLQPPGGPGSKGPVLGMHLPGGPGSRGPGLGMHLPGDPYSRGPGPGLQPPGGPSSSEPGWWPQQALGPGPRAPETKHHGGVYSGHAGMGPQLGGFSRSASGPGLGPQHPGGLYSQGMGTGAPYNTELELSHQRLNGSGLGLPQPGGHNNIDPGVSLQMPVVHQGRIYISSQIRSQGYMSGGPGAPMSVGHSRNQSPAGTSRSRECSPPGMNHRRDTTASGLSIPLINRTQLSLQRLRSLKVEPFPRNCSVKKIQKALQDMFGKFGEITSIQVSGQNEQRSAMVFYKFVKDRDSALSGTQGTRLLNKNIYVTVWPYKKLPSSTAEVESEFFAEEGSGTLYVTNLIWNVSRDEILRSFNSFGEILYTEVKKVSGLYNYGVVQFADEAGVNKVISEMNGLFLSRSMLKEKFGNSFSSRCIFVYGLSKTNFTPISLALHFCQFGTLEKVLFDSSSGRALVFFEDVSSAEKAIHEIREKSAGNLLMGDYANHTFLARFYSVMKMGEQNRPGSIMRFGKRSKSGTKYLAKENETQILVDNSEEQQKYFLTGTGEEEEEADLLAEASEEEEEADMLVEVSEKMEVLDEVGEEQEEVSPLLDWSEKIEASSDSGEEAAEPLHESDERGMPTFAEVVKKNTPSVRNSKFLIPVIGHKKKSK